MKNISMLFIIVFVAFIGYFIGVYKNTGTIKTPIVDVQKSWTEMIQDIAKNKNMIEIPKSTLVINDEIAYIDFIKKLEKEYLLNTSTHAFKEYLNTSLEYIYKNEKLLPLVNLNWSSREDQFNAIINYNWELPLQTYSILANIVIAINSIWSPWLKYSKSECQNFLLWVPNPTVFFTNQDLLMYSQFSKFPLLNLAIKTEDLVLIGGDTKVQSSDMYSEDEILRKLRHRIISDIFFLSSAKTKDLSGISDAIVCNPGNDSCEWLKVALKNNDFQFIRKKFESNSRKYDIDSIYIKYLIWDLDRQWFIDTVCLIK